MSDTTSTSVVVGPFTALSLTAFIAVKVAGTALASWSWWWLLMPQVPVVALVLQKMGWL